MTLFQMLLTLLLFIVALLASYILVRMFQWRQENTLISDHWEVGCRVRTARDPHAFLPGVWRTSAVFADGAKEWERIA